MNRLPGVLFVLLLFVTITQGCSVLSESQIASIEALTFKSDSVSNAPSAIFNSLNDIRIKRGIFYVGSLSQSQVRIDELEALSEAKIDGEKRAAKGDAYVNILNSYIRALKSLASDNRSKDIGREIRGIGNNIDSVIISYNILIDAHLPEGISKLSGKSLGFVAENITKGKQYKLLKEFMTVGDTLVATCCDTLISILKSENMNSLIENEITGLENNFKAYLSYMERIGEEPQLNCYNEYIVLRERAMAISKLRNKSVSALRSFKNAHNKIVGKLNEPQDMDLTEDLLELTKLIYDICLVMRKI